MAFIRNVFIIVIIAVIVILILNHFFFKSNILYDKLIKAQTVKGGINAGTVLYPTDTNIANSTGSLIVPNNCLGTGACKFTGALGSTGTFVPDTQFPANNSNNFMLSVWFFIDDYNTNLPEYKFIASYIGTDGSTYSSSLDLFLTPLNNNLGIGINTGGGSGGSGTVGTSGNYNLYYVENVPLQKWNCLIISVNDRTMDVYLEGKLINSYILEGFYRAFNHSSLYLGNNNSNYFEGYITRVRYESNSISPQEAYNIYKEGINSGLMNDFLNKYRLKVGFYEYDTKKGEFII